jgi:RecB family exonuclease
MPRPAAKLVQIQPIQAWSYSRYQTYSACPLKAKFLYIDKFKEPDSESGVNGTRIHALAALVATGKLPPPDRDSAQFLPELQQVLKSKKMPEELVSFKEEFKSLRKAPNVQAEAQWAFDKDWNSLGPQGWFDMRRCWLRVKVDTHYLEVTKKGKLQSTKVIIVDYKSGKIHDDHAEQRSLYALGAFLMYPDAVAVDVSHWYFEVCGNCKLPKKHHYQKDGAFVCSTGARGKYKPGVEAAEQWTADQLDALKAEWTKRTNAMLKDTTFAPRPGQHCGWCHFRKGNGGPCEY